MGTGKLSQGINSSWDKGLQAVLGAALGGVGVPTPSRDEDASGNV